MQKVKFTGRFDFSDPAGPWFAWSASKITARFEGTGIKARLCSPGDNYFTVILDNAVICNSLHVKGEKVYSLAAGLEQGIYEIALIKRTEFNIGKAQFLGFEIENGKLLELPAASERKVEIIGDSISCGFGIEGDPSMDYDPKYDNSYASYGSIAADLLGADCTDISCSGYGVIREWTGNKENIIKNVYSLILPDSRAEWDFKSWIPQIAVINLGTNDFSFGYIPDRSEFMEGYASLIRRILENYPDVHVICTIGPIIEGEALEITRECVVEGVIGHFNKCFPGRVHFLEFDHQKEEDGFGITNHPNIKTHRKMADSLSHKISSITGWKVQGNIG